MVLLRFISSISDTIVGPYIIIYTGCGAGRVQWMELLPSLSGISVDLLF